MKRRAFVAGLGAVLAAPLPSEGQQAGKIPRIGFLSPEFSLSPSPVRAAFLDGLRELGYVEGRTIVIEYRYAEGRDDRLSSLALDLVRLKPDVIVAATGRSAEAVKRETATIPVVMASSGDAVTNGLVTSLAHPGGNITGLTVSSPALVGKQMELLRAIVPNRARVGILGCRAGPVGDQLWAESHAAAQAVGVDVVSMEVRDVSELAAAFKTARSEGAQALLVLDCSIIHPGGAQIVALSVEHRLPAIYPFGAYAKGGGLMAYGPDVGAQFRRAAVYVHKILKGAKPADLPVEQPTKFELVINLKTANAMGLTIPPSLLLRADQVIE
jgi:putative ABC transport system substrate-binding protein